MGRRRALIAALALFASLGEGCASDGGVRKRRERIQAAIRRLVEDRIRSLLWGGAGDEAELARRTEDVLAGSATPYQAADALFARVAGRQGPSGGAS